MGGPCTRPSSISSGSVAWPEPPFLIEVVDEEARLRAVLPELDTMIGDGLITLEPVEVLAYRTRTEPPPD